MIKKFLNPSGKLTYEEALRQAGERVENLMKPNILVKGVNNSDSRFKFKEKGIKRLFEKEAERERRMTQGSPTSEIVRIRTKKADPVKKMIGLEEDEFKTEPRVIGMSGADPLMEFYVGGEALGPLFKLIGKGALYTLGRYYRGTNYGDWAAAKLIAPEMNRALVSNPLKLVPSLSQYISLTQQPIRLNESGLTSLRFLERPSQITVEHVANTTPEINKTVINNFQKIPALSLEEIQRAFNQAKQWHLNRINSEGYVNRALKAGFTEEEIPLLRQQLISLINRLDLVSPESLFGKVNVKHNFNGKVKAGYWKALVDGKLLQGIELKNPNISYDDAVSTFIHEFGHGATFGLRGDETTGYMKLLADLFPLINRAVKYNKTLYPEINESIIAKKFPKLPDPKYYANPSEILSRGYEFMRDYANNFFKLKKSSENFTTQDVINNAANSRFNSLLFRALTGNLGAFNFLRRALGISIPIGIGYDLYNNLSQNEIR